MFQIQFENNRLSRSALLNFGKRTFDERVGQMVVQFLERQAQPACLIAHNGYQFDFPLLSKQLLKSVGLPIPDIRCGDTLPAFLKDGVRRYGLHPYSLTSLYKEAFKTNMENHNNAECDAIALMKLVINAPSEMLYYFDRFAVEKLESFLCKRVEFHESLQENT